MFRSALTTLVIVLAVAFFMVLLGDSVIARAVGAGVQAEIQRTRAAPAAVELWTGKPNTASLATRIAADHAPLQAYAVLCDWDVPRLTALAEACRRRNAVVAWLDNLDAGTRNLLVDVERADEALAVLARSDGWESFVVALAQQRSLRLPLPADDFRAVAVASPKTTEELTVLASSWAAGITQVRADLQALSASTDDNAMLAWIANADAPARSRIVEVFARHGLDGLFPDAVLNTLQADLRRDHLRDAIVTTLRSDDGRARWFKTFRSQVPVEDKLNMLADPRAATVLGDGYTAADLVSIAEAAAHDRDLARKESNLAGKLSADGLVSPRQGFLILISLMVCMVGIANAMLMAITERFREIATMKCLGATDGYILTQFLMEAGIQGMCGGALGMIIGLLFSLTKGGWLYGTYLIWHFPIGGMLVASLVCVVIGFLLATCASIYPSWMASRMAPMEAMRIE